MQDELEVQDFLLDDAGFLRVTDTPIGMVLQGIFDAHFQPWYGTIFFQASELKTKAPFTAVYQPVVAHVWARRVWYDLSKEPFCFVNVNRRAREKHLRFIDFSSATSQIRHSYR